MNQILEDFSRPSLVRAIEKNAIDGCIVWDTWDEFELHNEPDILWTLTKIRFPLFNSILRVRFETDGIEEKIDQALARYRLRNVPMTWFVGPSSRPHDLEEYLLRKGLTLDGSVTGMAVDLSALDDNLAKPDGLSIQEVKDIETLRTWCNVMTFVYDFPSLAKRPWFEMHVALGIGPEQPWRHFLAWLDGRPIATSSLFSGNGVASIANVATLPKARRQGVGGAITVEPLREARLMGYRIGTLCSSKMGEGVYRNLGFEEYCQFYAYSRLDH